MKYPAWLKTENIVGVTAPSSGVTGPFINKLENAVLQLKNLGFNCVVSENVRNDKKFVSASKEVRAAEFMSFYMDEKIDIIIPPWGGELLMEILPFLDFEKMKKCEPKWVMGFSDISVLLLALTMKLDVATVHGPNLMDFGNVPIDPSVLHSLTILKDGNIEFAQNNLEKYQKEWLKVTETSFPPYNLTETVEWKSLNGQNCEFTGRIIGGCLDVIRFLIGTEYLPWKGFEKNYKNEGVIWYLESCEMSPPEIYRTLWQMKENGFFDYCKGVLYGRSMGNETRNDFSFEDALRSVFEDKISVVYDADIGHLPPQITIVNGSVATVSFQNGCGKIVQKLIWL